jgi:hypothetical protein
MAQTMYAHGINEKEIKKQGRGDRTGPAQRQRWKRKEAKTIYTHVSRCKNDKMKF